MRTTIKWYNRDSISDVEMKQARLVAERLQEKKKEGLGDITAKQLQEFYNEIIQPNLLPNKMVVSPLQYQVLKKLDICPIHIEKKNHV